MLNLLLDEHISPRVAQGLRRINPTAKVPAMTEWEGGGFLGRDDSACMEEAAAQGMTLVTYDRRTIPPLLKIWAEAGKDHGGVVFVDEKTISPADIGALVTALKELAVETAGWDWTNRVCFLKR